MLRHEHSRREEGGNSPVPWPFLAANENGDIMHRDEMERSQGQRLIGGGGERRLVGLAAGVTPVRGACSLCVGGAVRRGRSPP